MIYSISMRLPPITSKNTGQTLIGILIAIAVFSILSHSIFTLVSSSYQLVSFNRARITARHLAQERMEIIRNLDYDDVGTVGGIPQGILAQEENLSKNGLNYTVKTAVVYIDDAFNGTGPPNNTDYKRARVEVSWEGLADSSRNPVVLITDISANASSTPNGGNLVILVFDANGNPVSQATVRVVASSTTPQVDLTLETNSQGEVALPGAAECVSCYEITITKDGYSTDRTYSTSEVTNPQKPHVSVFADSISQVSFAIDVVGTLNISSVNSRENGFAPFGDVPFRLHGNKQIGTDAFAQPVYKYDEIVTTDSSGNINLENMEWDVYRISMPTTTSYDISGTSPLLPLNLTPSGSLSFTFSLDTHTDHGFFVTVKDQSQNLIASASARLYNDTGFETIETTGILDDPDFGQTLISGLAEETYHLNATASGFIDFNGDFDISGYTKAEIIMTPQ